jgi:preprotein translocase subunit SecG
MLYIAVLLIHVVVCIFLIIVVLLQSGKAADLAGAFGGMGSQTAFGPRGSATLLSKATTVSAVIFMLTSLSLSILATNRAGVGTTVLQEAPRSGMPTGTQTAPAPLPGSPASQAPAGRGAVTIPLQLPPRPAAPGQAPANTPPAAPKK